MIFAQMVDDPSAHPDLFPTEKKQEKERQRLFKIIEDLVLWENTISMQRVRSFVEDPILVNKSIGEWDAAALVKLMWET